MDRKLRKMSSGLDTTLKNADIDLKTRKNFFQRFLELYPQTKKNVQKALPEYFDLSSQFKAINTQASSINDLELAREKILDTISKYPSKIKNGALMFDIDGTLLNSGESFKKSEYQKFLRTLCALLQEGIHIAIITGAPYEETRIIIPLKEYIKANNFSMSIMQSLSVYDRGGGRRVSFDYNGESQKLKPNKEFTQKDIETLKGLLTDLAKKKFNLSVQELDLWKKYYEATQNSSNKVSIPWAYDDTAKFEPQCSNLNIDEKSISTIPHIYNMENLQLGIGRFPPNDIKRFDKGAAAEGELKGKFTDAEKKQLVESSIKVRNLIKDEIKKELDKDFQWEGLSSFSIFILDKGEAVKNFIELNGIDSQKNLALYFGDTFSVNGNDRSVVNVPNVICFNVGKKEIIPNAVFYQIGEGVQYTHEFVSEITDAFTNALDSENIFEEYTHYPAVFMLQITDFMWAWNQNSAAFKNNISGYSSLRKAV
ncbi:MAG: HAD hydrolase family protein [Elusimicrobiota bacterium]